MHATSITLTSPETPTCDVPSNGVVDISLLTVCTGNFDLDYRLLLIAGTNFSEFSGNQQKR